MDYAYKITTHGRAVMAACMDLGAPFRVTRAAFGKGLPGETDNLADLHQLISYVSDGAIINRSHSSDRFEFTIQFANVQHPEVKTFILSEFIVYVNDPETGDETDFLYGTLGDYRQPVPAYNPAFPPSVFNFPLTVILSDEINVEISAAAGLVTVDTAHELIGIHNTDKNAHSELLSGYAKISEPGTPGSAVILDSEGKIPSLYLSEYAKASEPGTPGSAVVLDGEGKIPTSFLRHNGVQVVPVTIQPGDWQEDKDGPGAFCAEIACEGATEEHIPYASLDKDGMLAAEECGLSNIIEAVEGHVHFWADSVPKGSISARVALLGQGGPAGGIKVAPGSGLLIDSAGNLSLDAASSTDVAAIFNGSKARSGQE